MKKILTILLALFSLATLFACSGEEENFHYDLIAKYGKREQYYSDTLDNIVVEDFGNKYNVSVYDIECITDNQLTYYYKYEGKAEDTKGKNDMKNYMEYLNETFGVDLSQKGMWHYKFGDTGEFISITTLEMSESTGMVLAINIPTENVKAGGSNYNIIHKHTSDSAESASSTSGD